MATVPSTPAEFRADCAKFYRVIGDKTHTQETVRGAYRAVQLRYLGLHSASAEEIEQCAMHLRVATDNAMARGWEL